MLHITNGDAAVHRLQQAGLDGQLLAWRDVLHEGPVPAGLSLEQLRPVRAGFIVEQGWAADDGSVMADFASRDAVLAAYQVHDEVVLWFEHDLYDQLQLIQLLDWFAQQDRDVTRLSMVVTDHYVGRLEPEAVGALFQRRHPVTDIQLMLAQRAWAAFRSPDPRAIEGFLQSDTGALPFLAAALGRHLEQFPAVGDGLSRAEAQALTVIAQGMKVLQDVYVAAHGAQEEPVFLGDTTFAWYLESLSDGPQPLVLLADGRPLRLPRTAEDAAGFWQARLELTPAGRAVLAGQADRIGLMGIDRWLGGVHLQTVAPLWRWDRAARRLQFDQN